ncbi:MAG: ribosome-associated translation inhibitor RaiA [Homoserinimonas sp.]|nr:ribosome-associated translation inhibitor RaiA [Cryobacterium sp.]MCO5294583.1 ribosome-associated translation inhibitor RaiA [Homoserinimonas sp.]
MEISISGHGLGITDRFRDYAEEKSQKVSHLADRAIAFEVKVSRHNEKNGVNGDDRVELTVIGPGPMVRAEATGQDKYAAFDLALDKLMERLRRAKDRGKVTKSGKRRPVSLREASGEGFKVVDITPVDPALLEQVTTGSIPVVAQEDEEAWSPVVIRKKVFAASPMTVDDALYRMELVGHDFYLFIDSETDRPSVVYRRKGWDYGVIGLDVDQEVQQELRKKRR